jgi:hypothetical protein
MTQTIQIQQGVGLWSSLKNAGFSETDLVQNKEILVWVAAKNSISDFRKIQPGRELTIPSISEKQTIIDEVRSHRDDFVGGIKTWEKEAKLWQDTPKPAHQPTPPKPRDTARSVGSGAKVEWFPGDGNIVKITW